MMISADEMHEEFLEIKKRNHEIHEALKEFNIQLNKLKANHMMGLMIEYPGFANSIDKLRSLIKE